MDSKERLRSSVVLLQSTSIVHSLTKIIMTVFYFCFSLVLVLALGPFFHSSSCRRGGGSSIMFASAFNVTDLDCQMRLLALEYAYHLQPWRMMTYGADDSDNDSFSRQVQEALQLKELCQQDDSVLPLSETLTKLQRQHEQRRRVKEEFSSSTNTIKASSSSFSCPSKHCIFVESSSSSSSSSSRRSSMDDSTSSSSSNGKKEPPFTSLHAALDHSRRSIREPHATTIVLRPGIHTLDTTLVMNQDDAGLAIVGYPPGDEDGEQQVVWISGAIEIPEKQTWQWDCSVNINVRVANLTSLLFPVGSSSSSTGRVVPDVPSLFSSYNNQHQRLVRARFPNGNPETTQWGYQSPDRKQHSIDSIEVLDWHKPPPDGQVPTFTYMDLTKQHENVPIKNDSAFAGYNIYTSGSGGVCDELWGHDPADDSSSYWCSNASAGGWAEVDVECAVNGRLQIPIGMTYNQTSDVGEHLSRWTTHMVGTDYAKGGIVHAWHSQTWSMHMFRILHANISSNSSDDGGGSLFFAKGSGRQGGRNWCRCDQCTYAAGWCGQHRDPPVLDDDRLISGSWLVENILLELDEPGEFYFDHDTNLLYVYPNMTSNSTGDDNGLKGLRLALLETLVSIRGTNNITLSNLGFRDTAATYMSKSWGVPSGGDWALHRGGAVFIQDAENVVISNCVFRRLDSNAVFLSGRTRNVSIQNNVFEWLGENAIATWGHTNGFNATRQDYPMYTLVEGNFMRELGIYQKQSSGYAHAKAAMSTIRNNIIFNMPRAAINFNDMMGGGDVVMRNLIFNTCRESGDHGAINTWDRQPFLTTLRDGTTPSFVPRNRIISLNFIMANYGAGWGLDNDDGSSWYHVHKNVFYQSQGFKMDYGGHDNVYKGNLVITFPTKWAQACIGFDSFLPDHGHEVAENVCLVPRSDEPIVFLSNCNNNATNTKIYNNTYYTPDGTALAQCGYSPDTPPVPLESLNQYGIETGSTIHRLPTQSQTVVVWAWQCLAPWKRKGQQSVGLSPLAVDTA